MVEGFRVISNTKTFTHHAVRTVIPQTEGETFLLLPSLDNIEDPIHF